MARRMRLPPEDLTDWFAVSVPCDWDTARRSNEINHWISQEIQCRFYMRDSMLEDRTARQLMRKFWFEDPVEGMLFAMRWT